MNEPFNYRQKLMDAVNQYQLIIYQMYIYGTTLGMRTELKDMDNIFQPGDTIPYNLDLLTSIENPYVKHLVELIKFLELHRNGIIRNNGFADLEISKEFDPFIHKPQFLFGDYIFLPKAIIAELMVTRAALFQMALRLTLSKEDVGEANPGRFYDFYWQNFHLIRIGNLDAGIVHSSISGINTCINQTNELFLLPSS